MRACVQRVSGVPAVLKPARSVRMAACVINTMGPVTALQGLWANSAKTHARVDDSVKDAK